jgi:Ca2+-binding EF-hand superfamily protein
MGEPFRAEPGGPAPQDLWFNGADTDHDGSLSLAEFQADARRFFQVLDRRHDGEIDPDDIEFYETVLAPEIRVNDDGGGMQRSGATEFEGGEDTPARRNAGARRTRQGAARFSYFDFPEPVVVADRNFNRGVDPAEFAFAANARFEILDKNGDGKIAHEELPKIVAGPPPGRGGEGGRGRRGGHRGGGMGPGGGGMGPGGGDMDPGGD